MQSHSKFYVISHAVESSMFLCTLEFVFRDSIVIPIIEPAPCEPTLMAFGPPIAPAWQCGVIPLYLLPFWFLSQHSEPVSTTHA